MKTEVEIKQQIHLGEDSSRQFKEKLHNAVQVAQEMCAMSNSRGGIIYVGVADNNTITGLSAADIHTCNQFISAAASGHIHPAVYPQTQAIEVEGKSILLIEVAEGASKPYCDKDGIYWVKSGSDKRKASPQELLRMFQQSTQLYVDETTTSAEVVTLKNGVQEWGINLTKFYAFFEKVHGQPFSETGLKLEQVLANMNLANNGYLTFGGLLLFGNNVKWVKPFCCIRAVSFYGNESSDDAYKDKRDCEGNLEEQFRGAMAFLKNNLHHTQSGPSFNSLPVLEIVERALEEALVNALLHRDYSKNAVIRLLIFKNRIEVISPGSLPNHLTIENIKSGNSVIRNPLLSSFGTKILPYSGIGTGILRILKLHPNTEFVNDADGEQFTVLLHRSVV